MEFKTNHPIGWLILIIFLGPFGIHKFIESKPVLGVVYFFTGGLFGFGWLYDIIKQLTFIISLHNIEKDINKLNKDLDELSNDLKNTNNYLQSISNNSVSDELHRIDQMSTDGWIFEKYAADLLLKNNFDKAEITPGSNDYGVDILAEKDGIKYAIQCKCYSNKLNNKPIQEVLAGMTYYHAHIGVVLTNNYFTDNAIELAKANNVLLWDRDTLGEFLNNAKNEVNNQT